MISLPVVQQLTPVVTRSYPYSIIMLILLKDLQVYVLQPRFLGLLSVANAELPLPDPMIVAWNGES